MAGILLGDMASAEVVHTIWELEPSTDARQVTAIAGKPFFEKRLLPIRMVRTLEPALNGQVPAGTPLFLVYNDAQQIGYCTVIDRSSGKAARSLFIPAGNKRPCFTDRDRDGRFDAVFMVFDLLTSPPKVGGRIANAEPMPPVGFEKIDPRTYPENMRMSFSYAGRVQKNISVTASFEEAGSKVRWNSRWVEPVGDRYVAAILNSQIAPVAVTENDATFTVDTNKSLYLKRVRGGIEVIEIPEFLRDKEK